jgi:signal transduction histidine kinase
MHSVLFKNVIFACFLLVSSNSLRSQSYVDSVLISKERESVKVDKLYNWFIYHSKQDLSEDLPNAERTLAYAQKLKNAGNRAKLQLVAGVVFTRHGQFERSKQVTLLGLENAKIARDPNHLATAYKNLVRLYENAKDGVHSTQALAKLDSIIPHVPDPLIKGNALIFLCNLYSSRNQLDRIERYVKQAKQLTDQHQLDLIRPNVIYHLGSLARSRGQLDTAITYLIEAKQGYRKINDQEELAGMTMQLAQLYAMKGQSIKAQEEMQNALDQVVTSNDTLGIFYVSMEQGKLLSKLKLGTQAEEAFKRSESLVTRAGWEAFQQQLFTAMTEHFEQSKKFDQALKYFKKSTTLRDLFENIETRKKVKELETQYETRKKEAAIRQLDQENRNKNLQLSLLSAGLVLLLLLAALGYYWLHDRQRRELVEKQKQWAKAVVESTDLERQRIASDLHDGVAQQLATIKMLSSGLADHTAEAGTRTLQSLRMEIDATSKEVRQMAHSMIPRSLDFQGLPDALADLLFSLFQSTPVTTHLFTDEFHVHADKELDTALYRIAQEACNNIIKHAEASEVTLRLIGEENGPISLSISDNGKGIANQAPGTYTIEQLPVRKTLGLRSMESRAGLVGGSIQIGLPQQGGTHILVQINKRV